jgi:uncharacterized membrane protein YiaA
VLEVFIIINAINSISEKGNVFTTVFLSGIGIFVLTIFSATFLHIPFANFYVLSFTVSLVGSLLLFLFGKSTRNI